MTLVLAMIVMIATGVLTLWLKPLGETRVEQLFTDQKNLTGFDTLVPGRFHRTFAAASW
ncbi:MAG: hypothetical protein U5O39_02100 [Gammaproteobacteria bacterium]|nr:hypothetical protein [Gammaproteobacteria bacterium]